MRILLIRAGRNGEYESKILEDKRFIGELGPTIFVRGNNFKLGYPVPQ
jgi:hypothetical protein